jgi:hypothetical protein
MFWCFYHHRPSVALREDDWILVGFLEEPGYKASSSSANFGGIPATTVCLFMVGIKGSHKQAGVLPKFDRLFQTDNNLGIFGVLG